MSLIGISGKKQSGKDAVAKIIQYLTDTGGGEDKDKLVPSYSFWLTTYKYPLNYEWQTKQFAGKLKQIVALITGCRVEDLENEEFKNSKLSKEWKRYIDMSENPLFTYRETLQFIGTDLFRNQFHSDIWINALFADYKGFYSPDVDFVDTAEDADLYGKTKYPNWIITDCRFPNEAKAIKDRGGIIIRKDHKLFGDMSKEEFKYHRDMHESETALDDYVPDYTLGWYKDINDLIEYTKRILVKEKII